MHPRLRFWLIVLPAAGFGVASAVGIAGEDYLLPQLLLIGFLWLATEWLGGPKPEAWMLAVVLCGYVIANRGFAQLSVSSRLPLLPAEVAIAVIGGATLVRMALRTTAVVQRDSLNLAVLLWALLGTSRLWTDFRTHGPFALRDFATIYYVLFFFLAQALARHPASETLIRRSLLLAFAILPFSYRLFVQFTDFFLGTVVVRGTPLVFYKDDLVAAYFFAGFFFLLTAESWPRLLRITLALAGFISAFTINSSRAAMVGLALASIWWWSARRWGVLKLQAGAVAFGVLILLIVALLSDEPLRRSRIYALYEHVASIVDVSGTRRYSAEDRHYVADNNRFRIAWWRAVVDELHEGNPAFGLGFGYNLADRFVRTYELDLGDDFTARSPHSILFTVLGRMGWVGLVAWLGVVAAMITRTARAARAARDDASALPILGWWSVAWVVFGSACFGVVLEGPMGAVVFWTALGFANAATTALAHPIANKSEPVVEPAVPAIR